LEYTYVYVDIRPRVLSKQFSKMVHSTLRNEYFLQIDDNNVIGSR